MRACHKKCEISFNPGAPNAIRSSFKDYVCEFVDVLILNLDEAKAMTGKHAVQDIAGELKEVVGLAAITLGKEGCIVVQREGFTHTPAQGLSGIKDTTGAGDAFAAGFMAARLRGLDLAECAKFANEIASRSIEQRSEVLK
jgi:sugar/nucleoside kinase (ribokinase family)